VEKHFCTASPDWLDSHAASKHMRAVLEERTYEVGEADYSANKLRNRNNFVNRSKKYFFKCSVHLDSSQ